jgi:dihydrofolate reductase
LDIILIAATTLDGFIARKSNEIITWSRDLYLFKEQTTGYPVIMGSNTEKTLAVELKGREKIVIHRDTIPEEILSTIETDKCFIIGGGLTNSKFAPYLTHLYLTPHPLIFGNGIKLFAWLKVDFELELMQKITVDESAGIYQFQYKVLNTL